MPRKWRGKGGEENWGFIKRNLERVGEEWGKRVTLEGIGNC